MSARGSVPWYRRIDWTSSFWVVLLLVPAAAVTRAPVAPGLKLLTGAALVGFAVVYVWTVSTMDAWFRLAPESRSVPAQLRRLLIPVSILLLLVALTVPALGWWYAFFIPFVAAILLYALPLRVGSVVTALMCVVSVLGAVVVPEDSDVAWTATGPTAGCVFVLIGRIASDVQERRHVQETELVASREREEIGRDVHDILGHSLTVLTLKAEVARRLVRADPARAEGELDEILELTRSALADVRGTVTRLRTPDLDSQLEASRTALAAAGVRLRVIGRVQDVAVDQRGLVAWALREATTNVARHAHARHVEVVLAPGLLRVSDDGVGAQHLEPGNGLSGLRERVESAGGSLRVTSPAMSPTVQGSRRGTGPGTSVEVVL